MYAHWHLYRNSLLPISFPACLFSFQGLTMSHVHTATVDSVNSMVRVQTCHVSAMSAYTTISIVRVQLCDVSRLHQHTMQSLSSNTLLTLHSLLLHQFKTLSQIFVLILCHLPYYQQNDKFFSDPWDNTIHSSANKSGYATARVMNRHLCHCNSEICPLYRKVADYNTLIDNSFVLNRKKAQKVDRLQSSQVCFNLESYAEDYRPVGCNATLLGE